MSRPTLIAVAVTLALGGCSGDDASTESAATTIAVDVEWPIVEQIDDAVIALEAELGGPQEYFEINATAQLVNLFVAFEGGGIVDQQGGELIETGVLHRALSFHRDPGMQTVFRNLRPLMIVRLRL